MTEEPCAFCEGSGVLECPGETVPLACWACLGTRFVGGAEKLQSLGDGEMLAVYCGPCGRVMLHRRMELSRAVECAGCRIANYYVQGRRLKP